MALGVDTSIRPQDWKVGGGEVSMIQGSVVHRAPSCTSNSHYPLPLPIAHQFPPIPELSLLLWLLPSSFPILLLSHIRIVVFVPSPFPNSLDDPGRGQDKQAGLHLAEQGAGWCSLQSRIRGEPSLSGSPLERVWTAPGTCGILAVLYPTESL